MARFSLEFFPPRTDSAKQSFARTCARLIALEPSCVTVTYGAMGSSRDLTLEVVRDLVRDYPEVSVGSHLTFLNSTRAELRAYADALWSSGVRRVVALRGDVPDDIAMPLDPDHRYFQFISDFVAELAGWYGFTIHVATYPEKHPESATVDEDIDALKRKLDAGADSAFTQFFFDIDAYSRFVDKCRKKGVDKPIVPGLIPIHSFGNVCSFASRCQAVIPAWLHQAFDGVEDGSDRARAIATQVLTQQIHALRQRGVEEFHLFSMNRHQIIEDAIISALR